jgi:hypothetical protein
VKALASIEALFEPCGTLPSSEKRRAFISRYAGPVGSEDRRAFISEMSSYKTGFIEAMAEMDRIKPKSSNAYIRSRESCETARQMMRDLDLE